jgi:hypothetical protein
MERLMGSSVLDLAYTSGRPKRQRFGRRLPAVQLVVASPSASFQHMGEVAYLVRGQWGAD